VIRSLAPTARAPSNRRYVAAAALTLFGLLAGHTVLEVARDSVFLTRLSAAELPFTYLMIAFVAAIAAELDRRLPERYGKHLPRLTLIGGALLAIAFQFFLGTDARWAPHAFYVCTGTIATLAVAQFWRLLPDLFTVSEAKRLYGAIAAIGSLGAISGAGLAALALRFLEPRGLLWIGAAIFLITALVPHSFLSTDELPPRRSLPPPPPRDEKKIATDDYLQRLFALLALAAITATLVDYVFKASVAGAVDNANLPQLISQFYLGLNVAALIVQLAISPRIFRVLGVSRGLVVLPALLFAGAIGTAALGGIWAAMLMRGADGGLRNSLHRSATELLYFPLSHRVRTRFKALVDALGQRGGQAIGSIAILTATALGIHPRGLAMAVGVLCVFSIMLALSLRRGYVGLFREHLRAGAIGHPSVPSLDLHSLESLIGSLNSESDEEVLASLTLLAEYDRVRLIPSLLLYHPSPRVVLRALELLSGSGRADVVPIVRRLLEHADSEVRDAAIRALADVLSPEELRDELGRRTPRPASIALLAMLVTHNLDADGSARREIRQMLADDESSARIALVRAARLSGGHALSEILHELLPHAQHERELRRELAITFEALRDASAVPTLIEWLGPRQARAEARSALVAIGEPAFAALRTALADESLPVPIRGHVPRTIAHFRHERAAHVLFERLGAENDSWVRYKILRALRPLREALPNLRLPQERVLRYAREALRRAAHLLGQRLAISDHHANDPSLRTPGGELLELVLAEKEEEALDRTLRLAALIDGSTALEGISHALRSSDANLRADGRELLVNVAHPSIATALAALFDEAFDEERLSRAASALGVPSESKASHEALVRALMDDPSDAIRSIAIHHAGEMGMLSDQRVHELLDGFLEVGAAE
jgi:AAA family ATP:ADP antiporter